MSATLQEEAAGKLLVIRLSGKLTTEDYQHFVPEVDRLIREHGKIRMLVHMHDFPEEKADEAFDWVRQGVLQPV